MIFSIIIAVVVAMFVATAQNMFLEDGMEFEKSFRYFTGNNFGQTIGIGLVIGAISYFASICEGMLKIAPGLLFVIIILFGFLAYECWRSAASTLKEILPFVALAVIFFMVSMVTASATSALFTSVLVAKIICKIPLILLISSLAFYIYAALKANCAIGCEKYHSLSIVTIVVAIIALMVTIVPAFGDDYVDATTADEKTDKESPYWTGIHYYNNDVKNSENCCNFGPNPYIEGEDVDYYTEELTERLGKDPALLAAMDLAIDTVTGTDYTGEVLYAGYNRKLDVLQRANAATRVLATDKDIFDDNYEAIIGKLESAKSVKLVKKNNIADQLYMEGNSVSGIPQVVMKETDTTSDWCLEYIFKIKSSEVKICFRIPCGFQWTNPYEALTKAAAAATTTSSSSKSGGKGGGSTPTPVPKPKKDPSKDPVNQGNTNTGGGKNKSTDGTGDYQATKPSKDSGSNADSSSSGGTSSGGSGSNPSNGSGVTTPIDKHSDSHDSSGGSSAGDNN